MSCRNVGRWISAALAVAAVGVASQARAVPYPLPTDGYYQLQNGTTFQTVCETGRGACDVAPGQYVLIDFRVSPARRQNVTVAAGGTGGTGGVSPSSFVSVSRTCSFDAAGRSIDGGPRDGVSPNGVASCTATCPTSAPRLYGVLSCSATVGQGRDLLDNLATGFLNGEDPNTVDSVTCRTDETDTFIQPSPVSGNRIIVRAMCGLR